MGLVSGDSNDSLNPDELKLTNEIEKQKKM
jgi:hypothetical protein